MSSEESHVSTRVEARRVAAGLVRARARLKGGHMTLPRELAAAHTHVERAIVQLVAGYPDGRRGRKADREAVKEARAHLLGALRAIRRLYQEDLKAARQDIEALRRGSR